MARRMDAIRGKRSPLVALAAGVIALAVPALAQARSLSITDGYAVEGSTGSTTQMTFTVKLSKASAKDVTVRVRTRNGTATSPADYAAQAQTLKFKPGQLRRRVRVDIAGDATAELNETFVAGLHNAVGAEISDPRGTGTIIDDDTLSETEPNDTAAQSNPYTLSAPLYAGTINPVTDADFYSVTVASTATLTAQTFDHGTSRCAKLTDTQLTLFAGDGTTQLGTNDDGGDGLCSLLSRPVAPGTYYIEVTSAVSTDVFEYALGVSLS